MLVVDGSESWCVRARHDERLADDPLVPEIARLLKSDAVKHDATAQARASPTALLPASLVSLARGSSRHTACLWQEWTRKYAM